MSIDYGEKELLTSPHRYKYLQKPLEETSLPSLLQYINRWSDAEREKFAVATGVMLAQGLASGTALVSLTKDHLVKNGAAHTWSLVCCSSLTSAIFCGGHVDVSIAVLTIIFRAYLAEQSVDHLATMLRKGGIKDLTAFFPPNKRSDKALDDHFRAAGLPQVADWWTKRQYAALKEGISTTIKDMLSNDDAHDDVSCSVCYGYR